MKISVAFSVVVLALFLTVLPAAVASTIWYVDGVNGNDSNDCKSSSTACKTIGHAISLASSGDTIGVGPATYTENLTISTSLKILGSSATTTIIDGGGVGIVMKVKAGSSVTVSKVTIQNGSTCNVGGGVYNGGRLTINGGIISGNFAWGSGGGVYNGGTLKLATTTISGNTTGGWACGGISDGTGGGVGNSGTLTLSGSTISGNSAQSACFDLCWTGSAFGGGVYNSGRLAVINSTLTANVAIGVGKIGSAGGGGIDSTSGTVTISNSTVSGNTAAAHFVYGSGVDGSATLQNSIFANNPGGNCSGTITSTGYNVSSDGSCNFNGPGDLNNTDPKLGPLQNNGGPTQTQALLSGSPAIDAGNPNGCTDGLGRLLKTDQRGKPRPDKEDTGGCDMGAYERQSD